MEAFINEESLCNQYSSIEEFLEKSEPLFRCLNYLLKNKKEKVNILKHSELYEKEIADGMKFRELKTLPYNDKLTKMKSILLAITDNPPYWDWQYEQMVQDFNENYKFNDTDVTGTSIAEAAERKAILMNFFNEIYNDKILSVKKGKEEKNVESTYTYYYFLKVLLKRKIINTDEFVQIAYQNTRLDFSQFEEQYGFADFEKEEIQECIETFERFNEHLVWGDIYQDRALCYKSYKPNNKENDWFSETKYRDFSIDKFRCGKNPKRCFGYKKDGKFYVLRMTRTHDVSDNG